MRAAIAHSGTVSFPDSDIISPFNSFRYFLCFGVSIAHERILSARTKVIVSVLVLLMTSSTAAGLAVTMQDSISKAKEIKILHVIHDESALVTVM